MNLSHTYPLTYVSLFSGIGGFEQAIHQVFPNAQCLGYSEIDPVPLKVYRRHFPTHPYLGPVENVNRSQFTQTPDLVVAGSPCKDLSQLRLMNCRGRDGLQGQKSRLFFEFVRIIRELQPRWFILENVANIHKDDQQIISRELGVQPILLNSQYVSAQNRRRLYWCNFPVSPFPSTSLSTAPQFGDILLPVPQVRSLLLPLNNKSLNTYYRRKAQGLRTHGFYQVYDSAKPKSRTLTTTYRTWVVDRRIDPIDNDSITDIHRTRRIHPHEACRLQTFPDEWVDVLKKHNDKIRVLGNAVTCRVIEYILCGLIQSHT